MTTRTATRRKKITLEVVYNDSHENIEHWRRALQMLAILDHRPEQEAAATTERLVTV